jgi:cytochrome c-type biogenesis protein CcmH/NrfG
VTPETFVAALRRSMALREALEGGYDALETWLVLGRALGAQGRHGEAEDAYRAVLQRRRGDGDAHGDLAQLVWRRTQDLGAASAAFDVVSA